MLLSFSFSNYGSVNEEQSISFAASSLKDEGVDLLNTSAVTDTNFLPTIVVYGANASGKSNLVAALFHMLTMINISHRLGEPKSKIERNVFLLDQRCKKLPTLFHIDFVVNDIRYEYGFEFNETAIVSEWLYSFPQKRQRTLFTRNNQEFKFGRDLQGQNKVIEGLTRKNSLFLSAALQNNHQQLTEIATFFGKINLVGSQTSHPFSNDSKAIENCAEKVVKFLTGHGIGISGYRIEETDAPEGSLEISRKVKDALMSVFKDSDGLLDFPEEEKTIKTVEFKHRRDGTDGVFFPIEKESTGTLRLLTALPKLFQALENGSVVVVDELDLSLHTKAAGSLLRLFSSSETNPHGAQLLATTHDTNLLSSDYLRRDQVWFTEKNTKGETQIYPLTDISTRKGDNIERGYLQGRFGAIN